jgi:hypothetical protein
MVNPHQTSGMADVFRAQWLATMNVSGWISSLSTTDVVHGAQRSIQLLNNSVKKSHRFILISLERQGSCLKGSNLGFAKPQPRRRELAKSRFAGLAINLLGLRVQPKGVERLMALALVLVRRKAYCLRRFVLGCWMN